MYSHREKLSHMSLQFFELAEKFHISSTMELDVFPAGAPIGCFNFRLRSFSLIWLSVRLSSQFYWPNEVSADIVCYDHDTGDHEKGRAPGNWLIREEERGRPLPPWQGLKGGKEGGGGCVGDGERKEERRQLGRLSRKGDEQEEKEALRGLLKKTDHHLQMHPRANQLIRLAVWRSSNWAADRCRTCRVVYGRC